MFEPGSNGEIRLIRLPGGEPASAASTDESKGSASVLQLPSVRLLNLADLEQLPQPEWLFRGLFFKDSLAVIYGEPATGKSLLGLDLSVRLVCGEEWRGRTLTPGAVVYVAGEGLRGTYPRIRARAGEHLFDREGPIYTSLYLTDRAVNLGKGEHTHLMRAIEIARVTPQIIVVDTLARSMSGLDENSAESMGKFIESCDEIRRRTKALVLVIHHAAKNGSHKERGSSALRGACDTMALLTREPNSRVITLSCEKQKDAEEFEPLTFEITPVNLGTDDEGLPRTSARLVEVDTWNQPALSNGILKPGLQAILNAIIDHGGESGIAVSTLAKLSTTPPSTTYLYVNDLTRRGYIEPIDGRRGKVYRALAKGREAHSKIPGDSN